MRSSRLDLTADCASCFGLCCVAPSFRASEYFAIDKPIGIACPNLDEENSCGIHADLRGRGFSGCMAYTCYGAGQRVSQELFGGVSWREAPDTAALMFQTLPIVRQLHELLWFVTEALDRCAVAADHHDLLAVMQATEQWAVMPAADLSWGDVDHHCRMAEELLGRVSSTIRATVPVDVRLPAAARAGALRAAQPEADFRGADLRGADLCAAGLAGMDLTGADLRSADLRGTDLRGTRLSGADLSTSLFLTASQLELAHGDGRTRLSPALQRPRHWSSGPGSSDDVALSR